MWDPFSWSLPLGRLFGITIRVHVLFPIVALGLILRVAYEPHVVQGAWIDAAMIMALLFFAVLLHELGHCAGARLVDGDAHQILIWPLGGLAAIEVPHTPRANFIATAAGPLANLFLCVVCGVALAMATNFEARPTWNPFWYPFRQSFDGAISLYKWDGSSYPEARVGVIALARLFWVNWNLFLLNVLVIGFPLDGGRLFQCLLWPRYGFRQSMLAAIFAGFVVALVIGIISIASNELLLLCLALFIYVTCRQQWILLETAGEESVFGYDFSQGYTSLEREQPATPRRRRPNFYQRWLQRRAARKLQREQEQREAEEQRMDELLEKVQREGLQALTDEERRFLKRVSDKYRNRN